jgi:para-nitrobenzyl esterase
MCPQLSPLNGGFVGGSDEDCLTLNVWSPAEPSETARPVMVWIHGGGFVLGSGGDAAYDGQALSEATGHVVVTLNYRLGPLGFLAHTRPQGRGPGAPVVGQLRPSKTSAPRSSGCRRTSPGSGATLAR